MQHTSFGKAELGAWIKVQKRDGSVLYRRVIGNKEIEVTEAEYKAAHKKVEV